MGMAILAGLEFRGLTLELVSVCRAFPELRELV
jgi:hypothetical protein